MGYHAHIIYQLRFLPSKQGKRGQHSLCAPRFHNLLVKYRPFKTINSERYRVETPRVSSRVKSASRL